MILSDDELDRYARQIVLPQFGGVGQRKLKEAGYVKAVEKKGKKVKKTLDIMLVYTQGGEPKIQGVKRISKPGRRLYKSVHDITSVRYGSGALILSTPKGIKTDKEARKEKIGGEALFEIW